MTINPCCIPLKTGVRMVTHLSMALALAVGWSGLKLISISSEVSSGMETASTTTSSTSGGATVIKTSMPPSTSSSFYNPYIFQNHQLEESEYTPPEFRIPYEYILYYKWHQQQLQQRQRASGNRERDMTPGNDEIYRHYRPVYVDHNHRGIFSPPPPLPPPVEHGERMSWPDEKQDMITRPAPPPLPPPPPVPVPESSDERQEPPPGEDGDDDEDKQSKIFRSILRHRKNFSSRDPYSNTTSEGGERKWNEELVRATSPGVVLHADEEDGEEQLSEDSTSRALALHRRGETRDRVVVRPPPDYQSPGEALQLSSPVSGEGGGGENEMNRMMMMRANSPQEFETADARSPTKRLRSNPSSPPHRPSTHTKIFPDFEQRYAKVLFDSGLLALCTVVFQFLTSFLLLCFADKGSNVAAQIWTAVHCSVIFCLATCLVLFLCEGLSMAKYVFEETLYLSLVTLDSLLAIYFLWVVMAFI